MTRPRRVRHGSAVAERIEELKLCGLAAVRARFAREAGSIERLYFDLAMSRRVGVMAKALARARKIYRCVDAAELARIAGTVHHGGIVAVVRAPPLRAPRPEEVRQWAAKGEPVLLLDRIGNAHNLGAIARTAAFFGLPRLVIPDHPDAAVPGEAAYRVAEGGLEAVEVFRVSDLPRLGRDLAAAGYEVIGAAARGRSPLRGAGSAAGQRQPVALVLGNEERGLAEDMARACTRLVTIPGSGRVESLNVSVAAAVLIWELIARR